jgi:phosphoenolpyruvate synthase/pyruvate phosphate dikinase
VTPKLITKPASILRQSLQQRGGLPVFCLYVGICGQGPSDHPDLAEWLMDQGIESMSLNPDTVVDTWLRLAAHR